jgi:hypothetical protein
MPAPCWCWTARHQITAANQIVARKMSVREAESLVKKLSAEFNLVVAKTQKGKVARPQAGGGRVV